MSWLIYGANGYTGALIAREAKRRGLSPILAGRSASKLNPLARELDLPLRVFPLEEPIAVGEALSGVSLVLHCAGPFSQTGAPMLQGCLRAKAHYLDISGEISCFEYAHARHLEAESLNLVVCPGVGFDVVPTDCVAATLKQALPDASALALAFDSSSGVSRGTAMTMIESLPLGGCVRRDGKLAEVPHMYRTRRIDFGAGEKLSATIPWGDVATAYYTTDIPNIEVYVPVSWGVAQLSKVSTLVRFVTASSLVQAALRMPVQLGTPGPDAATLESGSTRVWGEVVNPSGQRKTARLTTANGYALTISASLAIVEKLLGGAPAGGYYTPSRLMGADFVSSLPGSGPIVVS
ncbi:MAG TPA: saccharopine dehydrogenase NADP-binding domain-containing protein [Polyangiales bacterium]